MRHLTIGSRGSDLALWQARYLKRAIKKLGAECDISVIQTKGDRVQHLGFSKMEGKGFFTKEIEAALIEKEVDVAVHSYKDLQTKSPPGLIIAANSERGNPMDWLIINPASTDRDRLFQLKRGAIVGTSSARRKSQMKYLRDDVRMQDIRGNVPTRLKKLREGPFDALVMAAAGLERLKIDQNDYNIYKFSPDQFVPAPAQGVLAYQCREEDEEVQELLTKIHRKDVEECVKAERYVLEKMGGGCHLPLGVYCIRDQQLFRMRCSWAPESTDHPQRIELSGESPQQLAVQAVLTLKEYS